MSKGLLTHGLVLLLVKKNFVFMLKNAIKKKFEKVRKNKITCKSPTLSKIVSY